MKCLQIFNGKTAAVFPVPLQHGGGVVEISSLDSPDAGRGRAYAVVVVDECALVPNLEQAWQQTIRPMVTDHIGDAWFSARPRG